MGCVRVCGVLQFIEYLTLSSDSAQHLPNIEFLRSGDNFIVKDVVGLVSYFLRASRFGFFCP